jgi:DNA-binding CsgD family transcriptional regulator
VREGSTRILDQTNFLPRGQAPQYDAPVMPHPAASERTYQLWDEIADFDASRVDDALGHALTGLASLVQAQNAYWLGVVRLAPAPEPSSDPVRGWRPRAIRYLHPSEPDVHFYKATRQNVDAGLVDEPMQAHVRHAGVFRAHRLRDLVSRAWFSTRFYETGYRARQIVDEVFVVCPVNRDAESYFGFHRTDGHPPFTRRERDRVADALRGLKWFHRQVMLSHGLLVARTPLNAMEQRVVRLLLTELSEKEIADRLGVTRGTAHGYITGILRKFDVSGRAGLTALWLGRQPHAHVVGRTSAPGTC